MPSASKLFYHSYQYAHCQAQCSVLSAPFALESFAYEAPQSQAKLEVASLSKIPSDAESASPSGISRDAEQLAGSPDILSDVENFASSPNIASDAENPAASSVALAGADRRIHPRYEFIAAVEVVAAESGARIETRVRDLSQQGLLCRHERRPSFRDGHGHTHHKGAQLFEARARIVYSRVGKGMGWCLPTSRRSSFRLLKRGLPNLARPPGSPQTAEGVSEY